MTHWVLDGFWIRAGFADQIMIWFEDKDDFKPAPTLLCSGANWQIATRLFLILDKWLMGLKKRSLFLRLVLLRQSLPPKQSMVGQSESLWDRRELTTNLEPLPL